MGAPAEWSLEVSRLYECLYDLADGGAHRARRLFGELWEEKEARIWRGHQRMAGGAPPASGAVCAAKGEEVTVSDIALST